MYINKTRIISTEFFNEFEGKIIRLTLPLEDNVIALAIQCGFSNELREGEKVLPAKIGPISKKNAEGFDIIHRDQEKETCYRTIEWTWRQWIGRGETEEVTDFRDVPYQRYPRTFIPPYSIELQILKKDNKKYIVSEKIEYNHIIHDYLKHGINLFLELFHQCYIVDNDFTNNELRTNIIKLNWKILPQGEYPWEIRYEQIKPFIEKASKRNQPIIEYRLKKINGYRPDFVAIGVNGFSGYMVYGFSSRSIYIFESTLINNATYVFDQRWKDISQLTKKDILTAELQKDRIIHRVDSWDMNIDQLFK